MSYLVLARKWRPQRFEDVIGQRHVSLTLTNALKTGRLSHAYLFAGPRGIGKTTTARILAKALNCDQGPTPVPCNQCDACTSITEGHCIDVLEIDGASNRGIDDVRQLRESVKYAPSSMRTKVYIIDEVHMLTTDAFNALLKTLEEPPAHVYFIMATTEPLKVPPTILSRCQRFDFGRVSNDDLRAHLRRIADQEGVQISDDALLILARKAEGGVRDSLTLLDQVLATGEGPFGPDDIEQILGLSGSALHFNLSGAVVAGDVARVLTQLQDAYQSGLNLQEVTEELVHHFRNLLLLSVGDATEAMIELTADETAALKSQAADVRTADALRWLRILLDVSAQMRRSPHARVHLEVALAEMASLPRAADLGLVLEKLRSGGGTTSSAGGTRPAAGPGGGMGSTPASGHASAGGTRPAAGPGDGTAPASAPGGGRRPASVPGGRTGPQVREMDLSELRQIWEQVIERTRSQKAFLGSCLCDSQVVGFGRGRMEVLLDDANGFKRDQVEKRSNLRHILQTVEDVCGQPLGMQLVTEASKPLGEGQFTSPNQPPSPEISSEAGTSPANSSEAGTSPANSSGSGAFPGTSPASGALPGTSSATGPFPGSATPPESAAPPSPGMSSGHGRPPAPQASHGSASTCASEMAPGYDPSSASTASRGGRRSPGRGAQASGRGAQASGRGGQASGRGGQAPGQGAQASGRGVQAPGQGARSPGRGDQAADGAERIAKLMDGDIIGPAM